MRLRKKNLKFAYVYACLLGILTLASCSGGQNGTPLVPSTSGGKTSAPSHHRRALATATTQVVGKIIALITGGFTIQIVSGCGTDHAKLHIYKNSSTSMSGSAPAVNLYASITPASGSCTTSITAAAILVTATLPASATPTPGPTPTPPPAPTTSPTGSPIPLQPGKVTHASTVAGLFTGGFVINASGSVGKMRVYTNASTLSTGGTPAIGTYVQATGTGGVTSFTATYLAFSGSAPASITVSGGAVAATSYGFTLNTGTGNPAIPIVMNGLTVVGGAPLTAGSTVKVTGLGSLGSAVLANQIVVSAPLVPATPTPAPIAQKHVLTADYLGAPYGTTAVSWSAAAPYLDWAQVSTRNASAVSSAGIKTQLYVDPNVTSVNNGDPLNTSDETTYAHDCNGGRIAFAYDNVTMDQMNIGASSLQLLFANYVARLASLGHFDAVFEDNAGPLTGDSVLPCNYTDAQWLAYGQALDQASPLPVLLNGLSSLDGHDVSLSLGLLSSSNAIGGNFEHCYSDGATPKMSGWLWQATENTELQVAARNKMFECMLRNGNDAATQTDARIYALASFLLTYNPATSVLWEEFATPSGLHVEPESQLVLLDPKVATPASVASLQQTGGTYAREYAQCFYAGKFVGACAVVVNPDPAAPHTFPYPQYTHTLRLSGAGIIDGGTAAFDGPAPPQSLPASEAAIAF